VGGGDGGGEFRGGTQTAESASAEPYEGIKRRAHQGGGVKGGGKEAAWKRDGSSPGSGRQRAGEWGSNGGRSKRQVG
jgi:hypothetical protein